MILIRMNDKNSQKTFPKKDLPVLTTNSVFHRHSIHRCNNEEHVNASGEESFREGHILLPTCPALENRCPAIII